MTPQLIAIDPTALESLRREIARLHARLDAVTITPRPEWVTVKDAATALDVTPDTIRRKIKSGELQAKGTGKGRMVRLAG